MKPITDSVSCKQAHLKVWCSGCPFKGSGNAQPVLCATLSVLVSKYAHHSQHLERLRVPASQEYKSVLTISRFALGLGLVRHAQYQHTWRELLQESSSMRYSPKHTNINVIILGPQVCLGSHADIIAPVYLCLSPMGQTRYTCICTAPHPCKLTLHYASAFHALHMQICRLSFCALCKCTGRHAQV